MNLSDVTENHQTTLINVPETKSVYKQLVSVSLQAGISFGLEYMPLTIIIYNLSQTGNTDWVTAFGLGQMWCQCCGYGLLSGLSCGLETLVSQAFGAKQYILCVKLYYRAIFVSTLLMIPISILMFVSSYVFYLINGNQDLADDAGLVCIYMLPSIYLNGIFVNAKVYLNGQNVYKLQLWTQIITCISAIILGYYLLHVMNWGLRGCCLFRLIIEVINNVVLNTLVIIFERKLIVKFRISYLKRTLGFIKSVIPIGSVLWLELFCYELYTIQASLLTGDQFTAFVLLNQTAIFLYQFSYGVSIAATTYVGNEMGATNSKLAYKYAIVSLVIITIFLLTTQGLIFGFRTVYIDIFTSDAPGVVEQLMSTIIFMNLLSIADGYQGVFSGIVRGIGRETFACITFIVCYMGLGQVISYYLCFQVDMGMPGIWLGMIAGATMFDMLQLWSMHSKDWEQLALRIHAKIQTH